MGAVLPIVKNTVVIYAIENSHTKRKKQEINFQKGVIQTMLQFFITSKTRRKIITVFSKYPDYRVHVRGLAKLIREDPGNVARELDRLAQIKYVFSAKQGNTKLYWVNPDFALYKELQSMVLKTTRKSSKKEV